MSTSKKNPKYVIEQIKKNSPKTWMDSKHFVYLVSEELLEELERETNDK